MVHLPYDVWLEIGSLLDKDTLWSLRCLNSALREIALDAIYRTVSFSLKSLESTQHNGHFLRFREIYLARRVRHLGYFSGVDTAFPEEPKPTRMIQRYVKQHFKIFSVSKLDRAIVRNAKRFVNVSSLEFRHLGNEEKFLRKSILILNTTLGACINCLKIFVLQLPIAYIAEVMVPSIFIPNLLSLSIAPNYSSTPKVNTMSGNVKVPATIVPFLNRHRFTLTALHLRLNPDGLPLFVGLDRIVSLKDFSMIISEWSRHTCIAQFLQAHSITLEKIHLITAEPTFGPLGRIFEHVSVPFPRLDNFSVQTSCALSESPWDIGGRFMATGKCICKSASSLVSLSVLNGPMENEDFLQFFLPHTYKNLRDLHIYLVSITCQTLDLLENGLPNLQQLEIKASKVQSTQNHSDQRLEERELFREISLCEYSRWNLEDFGFLIDVNNLSAPTLEKYLYALVAKAMCSVKTFNGTPLAEFISNGPVPIVL